MTETATNMQSDFAAETVIAAVLSAKVASLMTTVTAQERTYRNMLRDDLATSMAELNLNVAQLNSDAEVQTAEIASAVNSMTVEATAARSTATAQMATLSDTLTRSVSTQMAAGTNAILAVNRTVSAGLVGKMNTRKHHWTGGCSGNRNGGWNWCKSPLHRRHRLCLDPAVRCAPPTPELAPKLPLLIMGSLLLLRRCPLQTASTGSSPTPRRRTSASRTTTASSPRCLVSSASTSSPSTTPAAGKCVLMRRPPGRLCGGVFVSLRGHCLIGLPHFGLTHSTSPRLAVSRAHAGLFVQGRWVTMTHMHVRYSWWKDTYNDASEWQWAWDRESGGDCALCACLAVPSRAAARPAALHVSLRHDFGISPFLAPAAAFRAANGHYFGVRTHASCGHTSSYHYSSHGRIEGSYVGVYQ